MSRNRSRSDEKSVDEDLLIRLTYFAEWRIRQYIQTYCPGEPSFNGYDAAFFVSQALEKWLDGTRTLPDGVSLRQFLYGVVRSLISSKIKQTELHPVTPLSEDCDTPDPNGTDPRALAIAKDEKSRTAALVEEASRQISGCPVLDDDCRRYLLHILPHLHDRNLAETETPQVAHELDLPVQGIYGIRHFIRKNCGKSDACLNCLLSLGGCDNES